MLSDFEPLSLSAMVSKLQTPFPAVSSTFQQTLCEVHSLLKALSMCAVGAQSKLPQHKGPDVPTTVSSMLSRSSATNTTTSTSFRDSLPSCSHRLGASKTVLSMVRTGLSSQGRSFHSLYRRGEKVCPGK